MTSDYERCRSVCVADAALRELVCAILRLQFGEACATVADVMLRRCEGMTLRELEARVRSTDARVGLIILLQKKCCVLEENRYRLLPLQITGRLRERNVQAVIEGMVARKLNDTARQIVSLLPASVATLEAKLPGVRVRAYLENLQFTPRFVECVNGEYRTCPENALRHAKNEAAHAALVERYGASGARLHAVLRRHTMLDQAELAERALLPPKDAREILYKMLKDGHVSFIEHQLQQFWAVDEAKSDEKFLSDARKAMANLLIRRQHDPRHDRIDHALLHLDDFAALFEPPLSDAAPA